MTIVIWLIINSSTVVLQIYYYHFKYCVATLYLSVVYFKNYIQLLHNQIKCGFCLVITKALNVSTNYKLIKSQSRHRCTVCVHQTAVQNAVSCESVAKSLSKYGNNYRLYCMSSSSFCISYLKWSILYRRTQWPRHTSTKNHRAFHIQTLKLS